VTSIKVVLLLAFIFSCFEVLNPNSPSILVGLVGLKAYFLYVPIAFILPYAFKSREHLFHMIWRYLVLAIPIALFGLIQVAAGPDSSLNTYVSYSENPVGPTQFGSENIARAAGTFSYISGYAAFLTFIAFLAIGYNLANGWRIKNNIVPILALSLVVGAMFTTGSRAAVYTLIATSPVILLLAASGRILPTRTAVRLCLLLPIVAFVALNLSSRAVDAFTQRANEAVDSTADRVLWPVYQTIWALSEGPALGMGIGTTHPSTFTIMGTQEARWLGDLFTEGEAPQVTVELGLIGLILIYLPRFLIIGLALRWALSFKAPAYRALGIVLTTHLTVVGLVGQIVFNATAGLYYWGAVGLLFAMRRFEQSSRTQVRPMLVPGRPKLRPVSSRS
jgi:hypothetical protein